MKASSILKKREHFLTWWKLVVKAPNYFHVSPLIKWRYAFRTFSANEYVWFRLDENDYRKYISNYERTLSREIDGKYKIVLDNKLIFEDVFGSVARVARSYAWVSGGHLYGRNGYQVDRESLIPFLKEKKEAVLKIEQGAGGRGIHVLRFVDGSLQVNGEDKTEQEILKLVMEQKKAILCEFMHQSAFENDLYPHSVNTIRMVVGRKKGEQSVRLLGAMQRIGNETSKPVDNVSAGAFAARIDLDTGELGPAVEAKTHDRTRLFSQHDVHPDTGRQIRGKRIPGWERLKEEIVTLTNRFPYLSLVAWDVMLTEEGFCLIEGNASSGLMMFQTEHGVRDEAIGDVLRSYHIIR